MCDSKEVKKILLEGLWVAAIGAAVAFAANALSPHGLKLDLDYFHQGRQAHDVAATNLNPGAATLLTNSSIERVTAQLKAEGFQLVDSNRVSQLYNDPRREAGLVIFIDARDQEDYQHGHIPGAFEFYNPYQGKYIGTVMEACQVAPQVVVYCHGGDQCDDSMQTARTLRDDLHLVPNTNLFVYVGGITEWCTNGLPVEAGPRLSGQLSK